MDKKARTKLDYIVEIIGKEVNPQNPDDLTAKLTELIAYSGNVAQLVAETEEVYKVAILQAYKETIDDKPPSTVHGKVIEAMAADASATHTYADKLNASLRMSIDGLRTLISLYKTETENATR